MKESILEMRQVTVRHNSGKAVLKIEELTLQRGELAAIVGPNGAGKSTLLRTINLLHTYEGQIRLFGQDVRPKDDRIALRRRSAMVFQEALLLKESVFSNVARGLQFRGTPEKEARKRVEETLTEFGCSHLIDRPAHALSGGEAQRVCIARALVTAPELLLLDEPFAALDAGFRREMVRQIRQVAQAQGITVLLVSHNFTDVLQFAERALVFFDGRIIQDDRPDLIMCHPVNEQVAQLAGIENIIACRVESTRDGATIQFSNGIRFSYFRSLEKPVAVCCIAGDAIYPYDEIIEKNRKQWVVMTGQIQRVIPGLGLYRLEVDVNGHMFYVRVARKLSMEKFVCHTSIQLVFQPDEIHIF